MLVSMTGSQIISGYHKRFDILKQFQVGEREQERDEYQQKLVNLEMMIKEKDRKEGTKQRLLAQVCEISSGHLFIIKGEGCCFIEFLGTGIMLVNSVTISIEHIFNNECLDTRTLSS